MITAELHFERIVQLPPRDGYEAAHFLTARDPHAFERLGFVISDDAQAAKLSGLADGTPIALRLHLRKRAAGGLAARVVEVGIPKGGA